MVNGQLNHGGATVVDLDGTLVNCNTLHLYIKLGLRHADWLHKVVISFWLVLRKLKLIKHETMKYRVLELCGQSPVLLEKFRHEVSRNLNKEVTEFLKKRRIAGDRLLLASAAAPSYIPLIWDHEFRASPWGGPDLRGVRKRDAVMRWIEDNELKFNCFITDHRDDLPLALAARRCGALVMIVNPGPKDRKAFERESFEF